MHSCRWPLLTALQFSGWHPCQSWISCTVYRNDTWPFALFMNKISGACAICTDAGATAKPVLDLWKVKSLIFRRGDKEGNKCVSFWEEGSATNLSRKDIIPGRRQSLYREESFLFFSFFFFCYSTRPKDQENGTGQATSRVCVWESSSSKNRIQGPHWTRHPEQEESNNGRTLANSEDASLWAPAGTLNKTWANPWSIEIWAFVILWFSHR